jgi:cation diffusion facilitator CzcD-associated flavoprotein CzcO
METVSLDPRAAAEAWLEQFADAVSSRDEHAVRVLFDADCFWRDLVALTGDIQNVTGIDAFIARFMPLVEAADPTGFKLSDEHAPPSIQPRGRGDQVEAIYQFETGCFRCKGVFRLVTDGSGGHRATNLMTCAQELKGHEEAIGERRPDLLQDAPSASFADSEPAVLIVGAGQSGLCLAARLELMGIPALIVEKNDHIGDNWRNRYDGLKLHNIIEVNEFPFMPFPSSYPNYLPKDLYGDWLQTFAEHMRVRAWTSTTFDGAEYDETSGTWTARVIRAGETRILRPQHLVLATGGFAGRPNVPAIEGLESFAGPSMHSTQIRHPADHANRRVIIVGTGTCAHDLAQELVKNGCEVTMVQRGPTNVISQPAANIYLGLFKQFPAVDVDLISAATSMPEIVGGFQALTQIAADMDSELIQGLNAVGFRTCLGEDDAGYFWDFLQKGGSYYIDVGASGLIIDGTIRIVQTEDIDHYGAAGAHLMDGTVIEADEIVLATGFAAQEQEVRTLLGDEVAEKVGRIWGYGDDGELRNAWKATGQDGLWFMNGGIPHARDYSRYLALQIQIRRLDLPVGVQEALAAS